MADIDERLLTLLGVSQLSQDPEEFLRVAMESGILKANQDCPNCGAAMVLSKGGMKWADGLYWRCRKGRKDCAALSVRHGNKFLRRARLTTARVLMFGHMWIDRMDTAAMKANLRVSDKLCLEYKDCFRNLCVQAHDKQLPIGGPGVVVEIDETLFGRKKNGRGAPKTQTWVFGGVERGTRRGFAVVVKKRDEANLRPQIEKWILPGSIIISDTWKAYSFLKKSDVYQHHMINHSKQFSRTLRDGTKKSQVLKNMAFDSNDKVICYDDADPERDENAPPQVIGDLVIHTNTCEGMWKTIKEPIKKAHGTSQALLPSYVAEGVLRYTHGNEFRRFIFDSIRA